MPTSSGFGCDLVVCAGDILDWGPAPERTLRLLREEEIPTVRGNHDYVSADGLTFDGRALTGGAILFIDSLPRIWRRNVAGVRVAMCHARPGDEMAGIYPFTPGLADVLAGARADVLIVGHTHEPMCVATKRGLVVNPGSVLREPVGDEPVPTTATFGVLELPSKSFRVYGVTDGAERVLSR